MIIIKLTKLIRANKINVVRAMDPHISGFCGLIASRITKKKFCVSLHTDYDKHYSLMLPPKKRGLPEYFGSAKLSSMLSKFVLKRADMIMPIRQYMINDLIKLGINKNKMFVIPHGIDLAAFRRKPNRKILKKFSPKPKKLVMFAGRLAPENYVEDIIKVAELVSKKNKDITFLLVGEGSQRRRLEDLTHKLKLNNIIFLGFIPNKEIINLRMLTDVNLCLAGGFSLIEAVASGKPVISYNIAWHGELVKNGYSGFLIEESDILGVAEAIITLINDKKLSYTLGKNARNLAVKNHSLNKASQIKVDAYNKLFAED